MTLSVFLLRPPEDEPLSLLRERLQENVTLVLGPALPAPPTYDIVVAGRPQREHLEASARLQAVIVPWAGIPTETRALLRDFEHVTLHNLHHNAPPVAELALTLLLAAAKFVVPFDRALRHHDWRPRYDPSPAMLLEGKTALILGYGAIGQRVARACRGFGMEVLATRRHVRGTEEEGVSIYPSGALHDLLPRADALLVTLPLTPATEGMIGARELALLPPGAVLVNVGRGPIVAEQTLYEALRARRLRAAGLDVWYNYPDSEESRTQTAPATYDFAALDNVVLSPHRGGATEATTSLRMEALAQLINAAAGGEVMPNRVDLEAGY
jgi:phosphoglycerate dehydrogenase-like enzyme